MTSKIRVKYKIWSMSCAFGVYQISPNIFKMLKLVIELSNYIKKNQSFQIKKMNTKTTVQNAATPAMAV